MSILQANSNMLLSVLGMALLLVVCSKLSGLQGFAGPRAAALRHLLPGDER